jgi:hypothetical protein
MPNNKIVHELYLNELLRERKNLGLISICQLIDLLQILLMDIKK